MDRGTIARGVALILEGLGVQADQDQNFSGTPSRVAKAYDEIFSGLVNTEFQVTEALSKTFPATYSDMVIARDITTFSMCPHHLLPVKYKISIGYMPAVGGDVVGISKLARLAEILSKRPVLQEQLTNDIPLALSHHLRNCLGAACVVSGEHHCMMMRGIRATGSAVITSSVQGVFRERPDIKSEFLKLIE